MKSKLFKCLAAFVATPAILLAANTVVTNWDGRGDALKALGAASGTPVQQTSTSLTPAKAPAAPTPAKARRNAPVQQSPFTVVGVMMSNDDYESPRIASFGVGGDFNFEALLTTGVSDLTRGGFYTPDGFYYGFSAKRIAKFDTSDWAAGEVSSTDFNLGSLGYPKQATYDASTGTVYACFEREFQAWFQSYCLCTVDLESGKVTKLMDLPGDENGVAYGMAVNAHGELYIILKHDSTNAYAYYPALYKVDLEGKKLEYIGNTNINVSGAYTGAAFDLDSGSLYFMSDAMFKAALNEIDLTTGAGTQVLKMPNNEQFCGIYIPYTLTDASAPARLTDLALSFSDAAGKGTLSFTMPTLTYGGAALSGNVDYTATANGTTLASGTAKAGEKVSAEVTVPGQGSVNIEVILTGGAQNESCVNNFAVWVGNDAPMAPEAVVAAAKGNELTVSWQAPTVGEHGGFVDVDALTYTVVLQPSGETIATGVKTTSVSKTLSLTTSESVYAEVTAECAGMKSSVARSNATIAGPSVALPYTEDFDSADSMALFTIIDVDDDEATWRLYSSYDEGYAMCDYSMDNAKNDWLITPALHLETGTQYTLTFNASSLMANTHEEILEVMMGKEATVQGMTITVMPAEKIKNKISWTWFTYSFILSVDETADYHIGFHALSTADQFRLAIDDIRLEGSPFEAPAAVTEYSFQPTADGSHSATLTFTTPAVDNNGTALSALTAAEVYVNNLLAATVENPEPGKEYTVTFETAEGANTVNIFTANAAGRSIACQASVFTGMDSPAAPGNIRAKVTPEGVVITWDTPKGAHGGTVVAEELSYAIGRYINGEIDIVALDLQNTNTFTDDYTAEYQTVVTYGVAAANDLGNGPTGTSNSIIVGGEIAPLPFAESFANGFASYLWQNQVVDVSGMAQWRLYNQDYDGTMATADNDNGCIVFHPNDEGDKTRIFSGLMALAPAQHPVLEFWYKGNKSAGQTLKIEGNVDMLEWETIATIELDGTENEWQQVKLPLDAYKSADCFQIAFQGVAANKAYIYVDRISVRDVKEHDLAVSLATRKNFYHGTPEDVTATVTNVGEKASGAYTVEFYADGALIASVNKTGLEPDAVETVTVEHSLTLGDEDASEIIAKVVYAADLDQSNNTASAYTRNHLPLYPAPRNLTAESADSFSWTEPEEWVEPEAKAVTDTFDDYDPFIIDEIGDWTVVDEDGADGTFPILGLNYPHLGAAKSWQVFNIRALGVTPDEEETSWNGHSGNQFLVAFADLDRKNDDWLISPVLTGEAQEISFWAKSINTFWYGNEEYEVLASSTGKNLTDFKALKAGDVSAEWTKVTVALPAGTMYFAIKCTSVDRYIMALDDITYTPGSGMPADFKLEGYNFYKNGVKVNDATIVDKAYSCSAAEGDSFAVTAVYTTGESRFSNVLEPTGISAVGAGSHAATVSVEGADIIVRGAEGMEVSIVAVDGRVLYAARPATDVVFPASAGIYIVRTGSTATKVVVR